MKIELQGTPNGVDEVLVVTLEVGDKAMTPDEISRSIWHGVNFPQIEKEGQEKDGYQYRLTRTRASREKQKIILR